MTTNPTALDLLKRAEAYLSALHGSVARHDNLAANLGCGGCELRDQVAAELRRLADEAQQQTETPACPDPIECGHEAARTIAADAALRETEGQYALAEYGYELARLIRPKERPAVVAAVAGEAPAEVMPFVTRVLQLFSMSHADAYGDLFWRVDDGQVRLFANVSDVFAWGGSDCEPITPDTLPALEQAYSDLKAIGAEEFTAELYTARQRGTRPQGAAYPSDTHESWRKVSALYDACGPERELGLGNPKAAPAHKAAVSQPGKEN